MTFLVIGEILTEMLIRFFHYTLVTCAYLLAVIYVLFRMMQIFPGKSRWGKAACWLGGVMSVFFIVTLYLRLFNLGGWFIPFQNVAYIWMTFVFYVFLLTLLFTLFRVVSSWI